jgi:hypothetical protein
MLHCPIIVETTIGFEASLRVLDARWSAFGLAGELAARLGD